MEHAATHMTGEALGQSEAWLNFQEALSRVAKVDRPVLLVGERGSGKELAARRIHYLSARWREPLVALNCAALAPTLIESELFGYEAGAFTGAAARRAGRFETADGGTLFLDELGNLPLEVQEKILRVVEYGQFERVGGAQPVEADVRLIGATNADLPERARQGRFMRDLLDRLSFEVLYLPPLRARGDDILLLARHFAVRMAEELQRADLPEFSEQAVQQLEAYAWPGNVRELKNVVERAVYRAENKRIELFCFDPFENPYPTTRDQANSGEPAREPDTGRPSQSGECVGLSNLAARDLSPIDFQRAVEEYEVQLIRNALQQQRYHQRKAAEQLSLSYDQFRGLYKKYRERLDPRLD